MNMTEMDIETRVEKAVSLFKEGYNCSQSVFLAYHDLFDIPQKLAATISAPLGGGMGRLREVCGAVSGMFLVAGLKYTAHDPKDREAKSTNYRVVQELAEKFKLRNGSIICRELLGLKQAKDDPTPDDRTEAYYKRRPCGEYIAIAARLVGEKLKESES